MSLPTDWSTASSSESRADAVAVGGGAVGPVWPPICGLQPVSLIDYPGRVCATLFVGGCNLRCPYCHNPELVVGPAKVLDPDEVIGFLTKRSGVLDGVCISGGEPTLYPGIELLAERVKRMGLNVKLDTNGTNPNMLARLLSRGLIDYVSIDVKAPRERYSEVVRLPADTKSFCVAESVNSSVELVNSSAVEYEIRTTVCPALLDREDILEIGRWFKGARRYVLQQYRASPTVLDIEAAGTAQYSIEWFKVSATLLSGFFDEVLIRGV